jgi:bifunctional non-homologous end joining protein LigD
VSLDPYRAKRDAARTPEPVPAWDVPDVAADHTGDAQAGRGDTFVVQEHHATALHWDVRLERDGVLVSWAVPKGLPLDPAVNHLAKQTEDHPLAYATFGGDIPRGEYGGGHVSVWDAGTYELEKWRDREVKVVLHGRRVTGRYVFFRTGGQDWMLHRMDGRPPGGEPLPRGLQPVLATPGPLPPDDDAWSYEVAWDGLRVLVAVEGGRLALPGAYPELRTMGLQLGSRQVLLDGEIVVLDDGGRPDPARLAQRAASTKPGRRLLREAPVRLLVGDLLHLEGVPLLDRPYDERRAALEGLELHGPSWQVPPAFPGSGSAVAAAVQAQGLPGVLAKRRQSVYRAGETSPDWLRQ